MSHEIYTEIRAPVTDDYVGDLPESEQRQRPTLSKTQAKAAWKWERDFAFFAALMRESTSYRSDWMDDLRSEKRIDDWYERIQTERRERERILQEWQNRHKNSDDGMNL